MGLWGKFKKETYINRLTRLYKKTYYCGDMAAIICLRKNYSTKELKDILKMFKESEKSGGINVVLKIVRPFKEKSDEVLEIDRIHNGN